MAKKTLSLLLASILMSMAAFAQQKNAAASCSKFYLGTSTGLENPSGILGFNIDVPVADRFSVGGGAGIGSWGYKVYGEGRFYFSECHRGWAIGAGVTYTTGMERLTADMDVVVGNAMIRKPVTLELKPLANAFVSGYHFWTLGRRNNRFYLQGGYSARLSSDIYTVRSSDVLTSDSRQVVEILATGGLMLAVGFSFVIQ